MSELAELAREFAAALVGDPQAVCVRERRDGALTLIELDVSPQERGRVIGRGGTTVAALRTLLSAIARQRGLSCRVEVAE